MEQFAVLWEIFINSAEVSMFYYFLYRCLGCPSKKRLKSIFGLLFLILLTTLLNFTITNSNIVMAVLFAANITFSVLCFGRNIHTRFFAGCFGSVVAIFANTITFFLASVFTDYNLDEILLPTHIRMQMSIVYLLICFIFYMLLIRRRLDDVTLPRKFKVLLFLFLFLGILASDQLISTFITTGESSFSFTVAFASGVYLFLLLAFAALFEYLGILYGKNIEFALQCKEAELQKNYFTNIESTITSLRTWRHDYHNHIQTMQLLLEQQELPELRNYLLQLNEELSCYDNLITTGNTTLDAILTSKILLARNLHIPITHKIFIPEQLGVPETKLCTILGNLLDNAIEACEKTEKNGNTFISVSIHTHKEMLVIKIVNSFSGTCQFKDKELISSKTTPGHGLGCRQVKKIAENLGGFCQFDIEETLFTATVAIPMFVYTEEDYDTTYCYHRK